MGSGRSALVRIPRQMGPHALSLSLDITLEASDAVVRSRVAPSILVVSGPALPLTGPLFVFQRRSMKAPVVLPVGDVRKEVQPTDRSGVSVGSDRPLDRPVSFFGRATRAPIMESPFLEMSHVLRPLLFGHRSTSRCRHGKQRPGSRVHPPVVRQGAPDVGTPPNEEENSKDNQTGGCDESEADGRVDVDLD